MAKKASAYRAKPRLASVQSIEGPFVPHTLELVTSAAWRGQSINCRRLIEFLEADHMNHAGQENGNLKATYDQLTAWGIGRRLVHKAISEAEQRGLVEVERGGRKNFTETHLSKFRLTYLPARRWEQFDDQPGRKYYITATNDWRKYREPKNANQGYEAELNQCTKVNYDGSLPCTLAQAETAENSQSSSVHEGEPLIYLGVYPHEESRPAQAGTVSSASAAA